MTTTTEEKKMSEEEFLEAQAAEAQAALRQTWDELKTTLKETASVEVWVKRHPWVATGAAVAGGFLVASLLFSPPASEIAAEDENQAPPAGRSKRLAWLIGPLFALVRPIFGQFISSMISAALGAITPTGEDADSSNGSMPGEGPVPL